MEETRGSRWAALLRLGAIVALALVGLAVARWTPLGQYLDPQYVVDAFQRLKTDPLAPVFLLLAYLLLAPLGVPVSPFVMAGGLVFGWAWGSVLNVLGTWLGAASTYLVGRLLGRDLLESLLGGRMKLLEEMVEKHSFWTLVRIRFVPIPYALVNYAAAMAGVRPAVFLGATLLGLVPSITVYTYFAAALFRLVAEPENAPAVLLQLTLALALLFALTFLPKWLTGRGKGEGTAGSGEPPAAE